jgi:uncharacterized protein YbcI
VVGRGLDDAPPGELTRITRAMVSIYKDQFGRGPRYAHSHYAGQDAVTCFLEGTLTPLESSLAVHGEDQRLRDIRIWFQYSAEDAFRSAVETATGRQVVAFISGIDTKADVSTETFVLAPRGIRGTRGRLTVTRAPAPEPSA